MNISGKKLNYGRSMIEMLGILALIGMLSVVSVYVFQKAMTKNRTNQLLEDMRLAGMVVLDGLMDKLTVNEIPIKGQFEQQTPYTFTAALEEDNLNTFAVVADGVPFDVCVSIKDKKPNWAEAITVNGVEETCHESENNFVSFFFNDELIDIIHDYCQNDSDCGECGKCNNRRCSYGFKNRSGKCYRCDDATAQIADVDQDECGHCKDRMWSTYNGGRCVKCINQTNSSWIGNVPKEECMKCPHQSFTERGATGICTYCSGNVDPITGKCDTFNCNHEDKRVYGMSKDVCNACDNWFYEAATNSCIKCMTTYSYWHQVDSEHCLKCPHQSWEGTSGQPGTCRYCAGTVNPTTGACE